MKVVLPLPLPSATVVDGRAQRSLGEAFWWWTDRWQLMALLPDLHYDKPLMPLKTIIRVKEVEKEKK